MTKQAELSLDSKFNLTLQKLLTDYGNEFTPPLNGNDLYHLASDIWDAHCESITTHQKQLLEELLSELPEKKQQDFYSKNGIGNEENRQRFYRYGGYDFALNQVSALIEKKLKEQNQ